VTKRREKNAYVEIGIVKYPLYLASAVSGLTEFFIVANRFASSNEEAGRPIIRVTHWEASLRNPKRIEPVFDSHPGIGRGVPRILIAPPSIIIEPISSEAAAPYARWLAQLHARGSTITSVCAGAFLPAEAKLLDGRTVTTHWIFADVLRQRYPSVIVDADKLLLDDGDIITAAGMTAWTDLALLLIYRLLGPTVMLQTARFMLVDPSGKEQSYYRCFSPRLDHGDAEILRVQHWLQKNGGRNVDLMKMAKTAGLEMRTFMRRFRNATTFKPTEYCQHMRISKAREMLELSRQSVERISWAVGYEDPASFRRIFYRIVGLSPGEYRSRFTVGPASKTTKPFAY
jgi:transcriptional regulator GlxA family with amidase domain